MRVCLVAHKFYEINTHMRQFASAFTGPGDMVDVIAVRHAESLKHETIDGVNVYRIQERVDDEHRPVDHLVNTTLFLLRAALILAMKHLREPYDLIHIQTIPDFLVFAALLPKICGTPIILDMRDLSPELYASKFKTAENGGIVRALRWVEKVSAKFADHVIVANPLWLERVITRSAVASKCSMFWSYPDPRLFHPRPRVRQDGKFVLLYPGTLHWHQGVDIAIRAMPKILQHIPEAELHIQGYGPGKPDLMALSKRLNLEGKVLFDDVMPTREMAERMSQCDVGLVPKRVSSVFGNEAASTKIAEFMATGVPVVASLTKIESSMYDDSMLRFFQSEDEQALADAVTDLYRDPVLRANLTANATRYIELNNWVSKIPEYTRLARGLTNAKSISATKSEAGRLNRPRANVSHDRRLH